MASGSRRKVWQSAPNTAMERSDTLDAMAYDFARAKTPAEIEAVQRLRYAVYVEDMHRYDDVAGGDEEHDALLCPTLGTRRLPSRVVSRLLGGVYEVAVR
jgi:hypothetical protein